MSNLQFNIERLPIGAIRNDNSWRMKCPVCDAKRDPLVISLTDKILWYCHGGCESETIKEALKDMGILEENSPVTPAPVKYIYGIDERFNFRIQPGSPVAEYLRDRLHLMKGQMVNLLTALSSDIAASEDEMVVLLRNANDEPFAKHRTYIHSKRRMMAGRPKGCAVRLINPEATSYAVAEGIETALAYWTITGIPTWAACSSAGIRNFVPPEPTRDVTIAADFDGPGISAAQQLTKRLNNLGITNRIHLPGPPDVSQLLGLDWADIRTGDFK